MRKVEAAAVRGAGTVTFVLSIIGTVAEVLNVHLLTVTMLVLIVAFSLMTVFVFQD